MTARAAQSGAVYVASPRIFCESIPVSTAPYCREARVTIAWRQTACRMRHCCARRIVETGDRRELGCTSTRLAERHPQGVCRIRKAAEPPTAAQQRVVGAETNRIATLTAANAARRHSHSGGISVIQASDCQSKAFLLGFQRGHSLLQKRMAPLNRSPARRRGTKYSAAAL